MFLESTDLQSQHVSPGLGRGTVLSFDVSWSLARMRVLRSASKVNIEIGNFASYNTKLEGHL